MLVFLSLDVILDRTDIEFFAFNLYLEFRRVIGEQRISLLHCIPLLHIDLLDHSGIIQIDLL